MTGAATPMPNSSEKDNFLFPRSSYRGKVKPENLVFNANLQEFAQRISYICNLETAGKIEPAEAYQQIKALWKALKESKQQLGIKKSDRNLPPESDGNA